MKIKSFSTVTIFFLFVVLLFCSAAHNSFAENSYILSALGELNEGEHGAIAKNYKTLEGDTWVQLRNGLTVLIHRNSDSNVALVSVHVKTGSIDEGEYLTAGLSHYLEHVVSGGSTARRTEDEIKDSVKSMGGASNAYTSYDSTVYFIETVGEKSLDALDILLDTVFNCRFDENEVEREKGVILREILMGENDPDRTFWKLFVETAYRRHPVRYPIIGFKEVFESITRDQLMDYYHRRYVPDNIIVSVAGNVDAVEILRKIIAQVGNAPRGLKPVTLPTEPPQVSPRWVEVESPLVNVTRVNVGFPSITLTDSDLYALDVLAMILGQGRTSRLYRSLKDEYKTALSVSASSWTPAFAKGLFTISMTLEYDKLGAALDQMWEAIDAIRNEGPTVEEFKRAQKKVLADFVFSQESMSAVARSLSSSYAAAGDPYFDRYYTDRIQEVDIDRIREVARKYLNRNTVNVAVMKPAEKQKTALIPEKKQVENAGEIHKTTLENGLVVLKKVNRSSPTVSIQLYGPGGLVYEPIDKPGISSFTASLLTKGTDKYSKQELASAVEDMGASLSPGSGRNSMYLTMRLLSSDLEKGFSLLSEVVSHPVFPAEEIEKQRHDTLQVIKTLDEDWFQELVRLLNKSQFTDHPYRNDILGTPDSVSAFTREDIISFYKKVFIPNQMVLAVFGDIDQEEVDSLVNRELGHLRPGTFLVPRTAPDEFIIDENRTIRKENNKSSVGLMVVFNGVDIKNHDRPAIDVLDALISGIGYPSGWLHQALRGGDRDLVYVVHGIPRYALDGGNFLVMIQCSPEDLVQIKSIVNDEIQRLINGPINPEELERAKEALIINQEMGLETNGQQAASAALDEQLGLGFDYNRQYLEEVRSVTVEDIARVADSYFRSYLIVETVPNAKSEKTS